MKRLAVVLLLLAVARSGFAYEIKDNPDRFLSVGANYSGTYLKGTGTFGPVSGFSFSDENDLKDTLNQGMVDIRIPATSNLTLNVGLGYAQRSVDRIDASLLPLTGGGILVVGDKLHDSLSGPLFNIGARLYFH